MYHQLKTLLRTLLPARMLYRAEPVLRMGLTFFYMGNTYRCNLCGARLRKFIRLPGNDLLCPRCGSLGRTRRLYKILQEDWLKSGRQILDFSPSRSFYRAMKKQKHIQYVASDISGDFLADKSYDITHIETADDSFDLVICYHVLEHIPDDRKAISELYRILRPGGICFIQTPFKEGEIYEDASITSPQERIRHFGQEDHVRIYAADGLIKRLENSGFQVTKKTYKEEMHHPEGLNAKEIVLVCKK